MDPKTGLYSKAAKLIRALPQERGTADQMIAAARLKDTPEMRNFGAIPAGKITREDLAKMFEARLPQLRVEQYGENPSYLSREEAKRHRELANRLGRHEEVTPEERAEYLSLQRRYAVSPSVMQSEDDEDEPMETNYADYQIPGANGYRERLIKLDNQRRQKLLTELEGRAKYNRDTLAKHEEVYGPDHPITQATRVNQQKLDEGLAQARMLHGEPQQQGTFHSSHWAGHPNVIAHIRMSDRSVGEDREAIRPAMQRLAQMAGVSSLRDLGSGAVHVGLQNGVISPQEAASISRVMHWYTGHENKPGIGKRLLHVEELQSDWGQEGRDKGFHDPQNPFEIFETKTGKTISKHPTYSAMWDAYRSIPEDQAAGLDYGNAADEKRPPAAPYVTNTQHWTDLALKNVLREAALGNYDGIVFTPGKAQANRYGLERQLDALHYEPETQSLYGEQNGRKVVEKSGVKPEELGSYVGKDAAEKLMNPENHYQYGNTIRSTLTGGDLKMGGHGMTKYYDEMVPKSVLKLAKMHDPDIKPAEPVGLSDNEEDYQGFHLPMTPKLRQGILNEGFPAMRRGGAVDVGRALALTRRFTKKP